MLSSRFSAAASPTHALAERGAIDLAVRVAPGNAASIAAAASPS